MKTIDVDKITEDVLRKFGAIDENGMSICWWLETNEWTEDIGIYVKYDVHKMYRRTIERLINKEINKAYESVSE